MDFTGKTYVVTGASSGIGLAVATRLATSGANVVLVARDKTRLDATASTLGPNVLAVAADTATEAGVKTVAEETSKRFGVVHGLAHCAGVHRLLPLKVTSADALSVMLASHIVSSVLLVKALALPKTTPSGASFVLLSSVAASRGAPGTTAYAAAKAGMAAAARCMAAELAPRGIRVNTISPGVVLTPQSEAFLSGLSPENRTAVEKEHPLGIGRPDDIASSVAFLLSDDARWITGTDLVVDGGLTLA